MVFKMHTDRNMLLSTIAKEKIIEIRLMDTKRKKIRPGDTILFVASDWYDEEGNEKMASVFVESIHLYYSASDIFSDFSLLECGLERIASKESAFDRLIGSHYTQDELKDYCLMAIRYTLDEDLEGAIERFEEESKHGDMRAVIDLR